MLSMGSLYISLKTPPKPSKPPDPICKIYATKAMAGSKPTEVSSFHFRDLTETSSRLDKVENVAIRIDLSNGCVGWGEAPILPFVTAEDQSTAIVKASEACELLKNSPSMTLGLVLDILPGHEFASIREGVEMTLTDAVTKSISVPLWRLFGAASDSITTEITIPIVSPAEAAELGIGFKVPKTRIQNFKVEGNLREDVEVLQAIRAVHPDCLFILDANEGYKPEEDIEVFEKFHVHRDDWEGLGHFTHIVKGKYGVCVAADESCHNLVDAKIIITGNLADVVNIKLAKVGIVGGLEIIVEARTSGLDLMIGGMVETRLAMGFTGHLAAGFGCFKTGPNTGKENRIDRSNLTEARLDSLSANQSELKKVPGNCTRSIISFNLNLPSRMKMEQIISLNEKRLKYKYKRVRTLELGLAQEHPFLLVGLTPCVEERSVAKAGAYKRQSLHALRLLICIPFTKPRDSYC
ncbi:LOW QUALITY PROTEIN: hypothetical protein NC653_034609 [Populus alba x Populus x berolinensis]|uniref:Enolase C-terminal domain-containing protein n=1 Tax=Populus alba x Populus x berolinensis TaxID=444605 RepID=A0AAD6LN18_9ROSI|nr:LOW QUALITY PROTEIN: hypothetical protein NC653_034609 [Populus alba x Populus x berolinensis]